MKLVAKAMIVRSQEHVLRPACAADENRLAVHAEEAAASGVEFRRDFAEAEVHALFVGFDALLDEVDSESLKMRFAHLVRPPRLRIVDVECGELRWREHN